MLKNIIIIEAKGYNPYINQATEAALLDYGKENFVLYLWSNDKTVFIGKNQNAFLECDTQRLKEDGGFLARRITGGGAVYHDKGNINYTFIAPKGVYDVQRQFKVMLSAIRDLGFDAQLSGRNDVTIDGRKFSGNAFYSDNRVGMHHGTVLIKSDYESIAKYLSVSKIKLESKGVKSVGSRVINLSEINPLINKDLVADALKESVKKEYGASVITMQAEEIDKKLFDSWHKFFSDQNRAYGDNIYYDAKLEHRFDWGMADVRLKLSGSKITEAKIYSDALDTELIQKKEELLIGRDLYAEEELIKILA